MHKRPHIIQEHSWALIKGFEIYITCLKLIDLFVFWVLALTRNNGMVEQWNDVNTLLMRGFRRKCLIYFMFFKYNFNNKPLTSIPLWPVAKQTWDQSPVFQYPNIPVFQIGQKPYVQNMIQITKVNLNRLKIARYLIDEGGLPEF